MEPPRFTRLLSMDARFRENGFDECEEGYARGSFGCKSVLNY